MVLASQRRPDPASASPIRSTTALRTWATLGGLLVSVELFFLGKWVTGPNFKKIPTGVDEPPEWMRATMDIAQIAAALVALVVLYRLLVRPWLRDREVTLGGLFVIAGTLASFWDGLSAYPQHWFNYNSYAFNRGSVLSEVPGVVSPNGPGYGQAWPFFGLCAYIVLVPGLAVVGAKVMRTARNRFPGAGPVELVAACVTVMMAGCFVVEAFLLMPLGFYHLGGAPGPAVNGSQYYGLPLMEVVHFALFFSVPAVIRFFVNDNGETFAERGANSTPGPAWKVAGMRMLAVTGAVHLGFLAVYHLPVMLYAMNSTEYPDEVKERSYLTGNYCGEELDIACPGPNTPTLRPGAGHWNWQGNFVPPSR